MKVLTYVLIGCLWEFIFCLQGKAQNLSLEGGEYRLETQNTPDRLPFYALKDERGTADFGRVVFMAGGSGWTYRWLLNDQESFEGEYAADSSWFAFSLQGNGVYSVVAEKAGVRPVSSGKFRIFYVHVPEFYVELHDVENCTEIKLTIENFVAPFYDNGGIPFYGTKKVNYLLSGKEVPWSFSDYQSPKWEIPVAAGPEDVRYSITITDRFGLDWTSKEAEYISVVPEAKFRVNPEEGEAPLEVEFRNESLNAQEFEWYLYKDTTEMPLQALSVEDSLVPERILTEEHPLYTYEHPGSYPVKLIVINTKGINYCSDTLYLSRNILVDSSLVDVPNVFTPNGDGINDIFRAKAQSLESFHAVILNRWGRKVYEWNDPQGGWNGKIHGKYASPGTYYYIITARGREIKTRKYTKKGSLLLIR